MGVFAKIKGWFMGPQPDRNLFLPGTYNVTIWGSGGLHRKATLDLKPGQEISMLDVLKLSTPVEGPGERWKKAMYDGLGPDPEKQFRAQMECDWKPDPSGDMSYPNRNNVGGGIADNKGGQLGGGGGPGNGPQAKCDCTVEVRGGGGGMYRQGGGGGGPEIIMSGRRQGKTEKVRQHIPPVSQEVKYSRPEDNSSGIMQAALLGSALASSSDDSNRSSASCTDSTSSGPFDTGGDCGFGSY